jgi:citronellol/citronellal dehydrogenase
MNRLNSISEKIGKTEQKPFKNKTIVVTGGSRGIGLAIAKACAKDGANIAILAKTVTENPKLPGTIYSAAK